ncbi:MAG: acyltransferase family protein [Muricomes sp.]
MTKNYNMEIIRTLSFVMVIVIHVTNYFCRAYVDIGRGEYLFSVILDAVARVSVPCFFMLSGALLLGRTEPLSKNGKRLLRFSVVLVVWSAVYYLFNTYYMGTSYDLQDLFYEPAESHLWYLYAVIPIYLVLPFFQIMCRGMNSDMDKAFLVVGGAVCVFTYFSSFLHAEPYYDVPLLGDRVYAFYFFMGYIVFKYKEKFKGRTFPLAAIFLGSTVVNIVLTAGVTYWLGDHYERFLEYGCPLVIISSVSFFSLMMQLGGGDIRLGDKTKKWIDILCGCSFGIYLIHILFLDNYKKYVEPEHLSAWIAVPGLTIGILAISFLCIYLIRKLSVGRYIS